MIYAIGYLALNADAIGRDRFRNFPHADAGCIPHQMLLQHRTVDLVMDAIQYLSIN